MTALRELRWRVEHVDTDAAGVVHFTRYASLLESALLENLDRLGVGVRHLAAEGLELAVREMRMRYAAPARFLDRTRVTVRVERIAGATCAVSGVVHREPDDDVPAGVLASGTLVLCVVERASGRAAPLPSALRRALSDWKREIGTEGDRDD